MVENLSNLNEYRNERIEAVKACILEVATNNILNRTDDVYEITFGTTDINTIELYVLPQASAQEYATAPTHVLNEVAIDIATALHTREDLPYSIDLRAIEENPAHIRIVKI